MLLGIDDVHWVDPASATALAYALRRIGDADLRVMMCVRSGQWSPISPEQDALMEAAHGTTLSLQPMSAGALGRIILNRRHQRPAWPILRRISQVSGGNPMIALEVAAMAPTKMEDVRIPKDSVAAAGLRLATMPQATRTGLAVAALSVRPSVAHVARAEPSIAGEDWAAPAREAGLVTIDEGTITFTHASFGEAATQLLSEHERHSLHLRLAVIEEWTEARAIHLAESGAIDADAAAVVDLGAQAAAARGAPDVAATLMGHAIAMTPSDMTSDLIRRLVEGGEWLRDAGDVAGGVALLRRALALAEPGPGRASVLIRLAARPRNLDESKALLGEAIREGAEDPMILYEALRLLAILELGTSGLEVAVGAATRAQRQAERVAGRFLVEAAALVAFVQCVGGRNVDIGPIRAAADIDLRERTMEEHPRFWLGIALSLRDEYGGARSQLETLARRLDSEGMVTEWTLVLATLAGVYFRLGEWDLVLSTANEVILFSSDPSTIADAGRVGFPGPRLPWRRGSSWSVRSADGGPGRRGRRDEVHPGTLGHGVAGVGPSSRRRRVARVRRGPQPRGWPLPLDALPGLPVRGSPVCGGQAGRGRGPGRAAQGRSRHSPTPPQPA